MKAVYLSTGRFKPIRWTLLFLFLTVSLLLVSCVIWYHSFSDIVFRRLLIAAFVICGASAFLFIRPIFRAFAAYVVLLLPVLFLWISLEPKQDRDWSAEYIKLPRAEVNGSIITFHNVRNFAYRSESESIPRWETRSYDMNKIQGVDLFLSYWGPTNIAHTIISWDFGEDGHLAVSIETRREADEGYSAVAGFFREYELYYVVADEADLVGLRTNYRNEDVYLYRLRVSAEKSRAALMDYVASINSLDQTPEWYNALTQNCTTSIRIHAEHIGVAKPWNWRLLANGHLDQLWYTNGFINASEPFDVIRKRSAISKSAKAAGVTANFSQDIRAGIPKRPN